MVYDSVYEANNYLRSGVNISKDTTKDGTNSNITLDTTNEKLGTGCYDFNGSTSRSVTSVKFNGLHDNTGGSISFWMRPRNMSSIHGNGDIIFDSMATSAANGTGISIAIKNTSLLRVNFTTSSNQWFTDINSTTQFANNTWYHVVMTFGSNTVKLYINGTQETSFGTADYPNQNLELSMNQNHITRIGTRATSPSGKYFDGYMCETVLVDGSQLAPDQFGEFDSDSGIISGKMSDTDRFLRKYSWEPWARLQGDVNENGEFISFADSLDFDYTDFEMPDPRTWKVSVIGRNISRGIIVLEHGSNEEFEVGQEITQTNSGSSDVTAILTRKLETFEKLVDRGTRIIQKITGLDYDRSEEALIRANKSVKTAIVMIKKNCELIDAEEKLRNADGSLRQVIDT